MRRPHVVATFAATLVAASASTAVAGPIPAWCKDHAFDGEASINSLTHPDLKVIVTTLAHAACVSSPEVETNRASIEQNRQAWGKRLGMQEADWADVVAYDKDRAKDPVYSTKDVTKYTPVDQYMAIVEGFERPGGVGPLREPIYATDVFEGKLSEVGRFGSISRCLGTAGVGRPGPVDWAICAGDIAAFDLAKFHQELHADTVHDGSYKMRLRFAALDIAAQLKKHDAEVKAAWAKDPAYKKMFDIAAAARTEWATTMAKETALLELVAQAEAAHFSSSRSALAACSEKTAAALAEQVGHVPAKALAKQFDERFDPTNGAATKMMPLLLAKPAVNLAVIAYALCNKDDRSNMLVLALRGTPSTRGPRTLVFTRLLSEKIQLDDENERLTFPEIERPYDRPGGAILSSGGVVGSTVPDGNLVTVKFEKLIVKREECTQSHQTKKIYKLHADGRVEYEQVCDKMGVVAHDEQWSDFQVDKKYLPLLKKGVRISVTGTDLFAIWPGAKADVPSWVLGAPVR